MFLRVALVGMLLLSTGCLGHCGPTLHRILFSNPLPVLFSESNQALALDAVEAMGYNVTSSGSGGFSTAALNGWAIWIERDEYETEGGMTFHMRVYAGDREYDSMDRAREMGHRQAPQHWPTFNATLADFNERTGWNTTAASTVEPEVLIC